jgi:hypothetical protein
MCWVMLSGSFLFWVVMSFLCKVRFCVLWVWVGVERVLRDGVRGVWVIGKIIGVGDVGG